MSIEIKQKIKEVADDLKMPTKEVIEIVGKFYDKPKSSSQNLTEDQLNVIFDHITRNHQIDSLEQVFAVKAAPAPAPAPAPASAQRPQTPAAPAGSAPAAAPAQNPQRAPQGTPRPQTNSGNQKQSVSASGGQPQQPAKPKEPERKRERRVIDTSAVTVNADR